MSRKNEPRVPKGQLHRLLTDKFCCQNETAGTTGMLARLFRIFMTNVNMTLDKWTRLSNQYVRAKELEKRDFYDTQDKPGYQMSKSDATTLTTNLRNALSSSNMTWNIHCNAMQFLDTPYFTINVSAQQPHTGTTHTASTTIYTSKRLTAENKGVPEEQALNDLVNQLLKSIGLSTEKTNTPLWQEYLSNYTSRVVSERRNRGDKDASESQVRVSILKSITREAMTWPSFNNNLRLMRFSRVDFEEIIWQKVYKQEELEGLVARIYISVDESTDESPNED